MTNALASAISKWNSPMQLLESSTSPEEQTSESPRPSLPNTLSTVSQGRDDELERQQSEALATCNKRLAVSVLLDERYWFDSYVDESRSAFWPRFSNLAYFCNVKARVWARVVIQSPVDPQHRAWETLHVESSPKFRRAWGSKNPASFIQSMPFHRYADCFGYFPKEFWERELLIASLTLRIDNEHDGISDTTQQLLALAGF